MAYEVQHCPESNRFQICLTGEAKAVLLYKVSESSSVTTWDCYHTEVPESHQGQGLGGMLAGALFQHAVEAGLHLKLTCTYLQHYLKKHPEHRDIVV